MFLKKYSVCRIFIHGSPFLIGPFCFLIPPLSLLVSRSVCNCFAQKQAPIIHIGLFTIQTFSRVAKCHEYDEYIRVKIFAGWGKKSGRRCNLAKFSLFWEDLHNLARFLCINQPNLIELSTLVHQNYPFCTFYFTSVPKLSLFTRFSWGKIQFKGFAPCKRIDISQLCSGVIIEHG